MYIRPVVRKAPGPKLQFVSVQTGTGAVVSKWVPVYDNAVPIPNGTPGRVGEICDLMYRGAPCARQTEWAPPLEYKRIARMYPDGVREAYIAKCEAWFDAHPPPNHVTRQPPVYDRELVMALFAKYPGKVPPFEERVKVYRAAGKSEAYIEYVIARHKRDMERKDEDQANIDRIFPNVKSAPTKKPVPKVIKAVKKRM